MSYDVLGPGPLDYLPCRYGVSRLLFRGPKRSLDSPYIAFIGGTETYGKFIEHPFPALLEDRLGTTCLNLGQLNAGIDVFAQDPFVLEASSKADVTVVQILGAANMTNRFYSVHPRRNDRFVEASSLLQTIYREVDFSEFHFNKHMLSSLRSTSEDRFDTVLQELRAAWLARMKLMLRQIKGKTVLLWLSTRAVDDAAVSAQGLGPDPLFVSRDMIEEIRPLATAVLEVVASQAAIDAGTEGMVFGELDALAAAEILGPAAHQEVVDALAEVLATL